MCSSLYVAVASSVVVCASLLATSLVMFKEPPLVVGAELDTFYPPPWPSEHTDSEGRPLAYQEDGRYQNPWMKDRPSPIKFFKSWFFGSDDSNIPSTRLLEETLPVKSPVWLSENFSVSEARLTWLGHATVLAEIDHFTILTDPIFSERASIVQFAGPKRYTAPACKVSELPNITAVVISHNHYDHLDINTVSKLARLQPNIQWFVPAGLGKWMLDNTEARPETVRELTWWQEVELEEAGGLRFVFTPANHWCKRGLSDDNKVLWGSWAVLGPSNRFWFGGDTGYCEAFKHIGDTYGPFDLAAIPIGAYQPNWFMKYQHVHPGEAVEVHKDVQSRKSLGIHWGTFKLTTENYLEPPALLNTFLNRSGLENDVFVTTDIGTSIEP